MEKVLSRFQLEGRPLSCERYGTHFIICVNFLMKISKILRL